MARYKTLVTWKYEPRGKPDYWRTFQPVEMFEYPDTSVFPTKVLIESLISQNVIKEADNG